MGVPFNAVSGDIRVASGSSALGTVAFGVSEPAPWLNVSTLVASTKAFDVLKQLSSVAVSHSTGTVYAADTSHHAIKVISSSGQVMMTIGTGRPGLTDGPAAQAELKEPTGVAFDERLSLLYVADTANHVIRRVTQDGRVTTVAGDGTAGDRDGSGSGAAFNRPAGLAVDASGIFYIADSGNHKIRALLPNGSVITVAGSGLSGTADGAAGTAAFNGPEGIAVHEGAIYVADTKNHRIRVLRGGVLSTVAGSGQPGRVNGAALQASFNQPAGVAVLDDGTLVVADRLNHQLRTVNTSGIVGTLSGTGNPGYVDSTNPAQAQFAAPEGVAYCGMIVVGDTQRGRTTGLPGAGRISHLSVQWRAGGCKSCHLRGIVEPDDAVQCRQRRAAGNRTGRIAVQHDRESCRAVGAGRRHADRHRMQMQQ